MQCDLLLNVISRLLGRPIEEKVLTLTLQRLRMEHVARWLHRRIAGMPAVEGKYCIDMLDRLSEDAATTLLRAPAVCQALRRVAPTSLLMCQLTIAHAQWNSECLDIWSVMGDCWLGRTMPVSHFDLMKTAGRYYSPRLSCGVPLDLSLDAFVSYPSAGLKQPSIPCSSELVKALAHLNKALTLLSVIYPIGYHLVETLVSNIIVRVDHARFGECWGATSGIAIGRIVIVNPGSQPDMFMLGETLLHEAIHCAVDCAELFNPMWQNSKPSNNSTELAVSSPWTGNILTPHAFLHAFIVWYILLRYWVACECHCGVTEASKNRRNFIKRGFDKLNRSIDLRHACQTLAPDAMDVILVTLN